MSIKTNELQQITAPQGSDSLLLDTAAAGTGQLTMARAAEFFGTELVKQTNSVGVALSQKADAGPPTWYDLQLAEGFKPLGYPSYNQYCKDEFGLVAVRLMCITVDRSNVADGTVIATLPEGFRPPINYSQRATHWDGQRGKLARVEVSHTGAITAYGYDQSGFASINFEILFHADA